MRKLKSDRDENNSSMNRQEIIKRNEVENKYEGDRVIDMRKNDNSRYKKEIESISVEGKEMKLQEVEEREKNKENSSIHGPRSLDVLCSEFHVLMKQLEASATATGAATGAGAGAGSINHIYSKPLSSSLPTQLPMSMPMSESYQTDFKESISGSNDQISSYQSLERMHHTALKRIEEQQKTISDQKNKNQNTYDYESKSQIKTIDVNMIEVKEKNEVNSKNVLVDAGISVKCLQHDEEEDQLRSPHHIGPLHSKASTNTSPLYERVEQTKGDQLLRTMASFPSSSSSFSSSSSMPLRNITARNIMEGVVEEKDLERSISVRQTAFYKVVKHIEDEGVDEGNREEEKIEEEEEREGEGEETEEVMDIGESADGDGEEKKIDQSDGEEEAEGGEREESEDDSEEEEEVEGEEEEGSKIDESSDGDDDSDSDENNCDDDDDDIQQSEANKNKTKVTRYRTRYSTHPARVSSIRQSFNDFLEADTCNQTHQHNAAIAAENLQHRYKERKESNAVNDEMYDMDDRGFDDSVLMRPDVYQEKYQSIMAVGLDDEESEEEDNQEVVGKDEVEEESDDIVSNLSKLSLNEEKDEKIGIGKEREREREKKSGDNSVDKELDHVSGIDSVLRLSKNEDENRYFYDETFMIQENVGRYHKKGKNNSKMEKRNKKKIEKMQLYRMKENHHDDDYDFDNDSNEGDDGSEERKHFKDIEEDRPDKIGTQSYTELDKEDGEEGRSVKSLSDALREERCLRFRMSRRMQTSNDEVH